MQAAVVAFPAEYDPARHSPLTAASPALAQYFPAGHGVQAAVAALPAEYDLARHSPLTAESPTLEQNFPAKQFVG